MNRHFVVCIALCLFTLGCGGGKPDKAVVDKKAREGLAKVSGEWKDIAVEMKLDGKVTTVGANRDVDGNPHWFSFTGSDGKGGVAVRNPGGQWLCKYQYDTGGKETSAEKMTGTDEDIGKFRSLAAEFSAACIAASK